MATIQFAMECPTCQKEVVLYDSAEAPAKSELIASTCTCGTRLTLWHDGEGWRVRVQSIEQVAA